MQQDLFETGLEQRKATLGAAYVEANLASADDFTRPFQEAMTAWCWGFGWGDEAIDAKTRSMMNLAMIGALGKMHEWEIHCRGAINNGVSVEEIRAIIHVVGIYCGVPQSLECLRVARKVLEEQGLLFASLLFLVAGAPKSLGGPGRRRARTEGAWNGLGKSKDNLIRVSDRI